MEIGGHPIYGRGAYLILRANCRCRVPPRPAVPWAPREALMGPRVSTSAATCRLQQQQHQLLLLLPLLQRQLLLLQPLLLLLLLLAITTHYY